LAKIKKKPSQTGSARKFFMFLKENFLIPIFLNYFTPLSSHKKQA